jgi:hypothetical protein
MKEFLDIEKIQLLFSHTSLVASTDLDTKVQAALIAAFTSILVSMLSALFSAWQAQKSQARSREAQMELEKFKLDLSSHYKNVEEQHKSILDLIGSIQGLRDEIYKIVQDRFKGFDTKTAHQKIDSCVNELTKCYQQNQEYLESERDLIHKVKNSAMANSNLKRNISYWYEKAA